MEEMQTTEQYVQANTDTDTSEVIIVDNTTNYPVEKPNPLDVLIKTFGDLLLENDDFNYNIVRSSAERVTDTFDIDDHLDMDDLAEKVTYSMSISDLAESVVEEMDMGNLADNVLESIDYSDLASDLTDHIDFAYEVDRHVDVADKAYDLLSDYNPSNTCSLGDQFTQAIARALGYMMENEDNENYEVIKFLMNRNAIVMERVVDSDKNVVEENIVAAEGEVFRNDDANLTDAENFVPSEIPATNVQEHAIEAMKRVVHEVLASYVPTYADDPYMKIRLEAKAFDTFTDYMNGKW